MEKTYIVNGQVYLDHRFAQATVGMEAGKLQILPPDCPTADGAVFDASGMKLVPGFIDTHTHGAVGVDVNGATAEDLEKISCFMASRGTTAWQCSILTDTREQTEWCIGEFKRHEKMEQNGADLVGIHLEGPFLAKEYKGAMPEHLLKKNDLELVRHYQTLAEGKINYITISPELEGVQEMIPALVEMGIVVGIGHSGATYDQAMGAIGLGATVGTHVGNAMRLFHQHEPAIFGAIMESDVYCETICDGRHLVPGSVRMYCKCKGLDRIVAITDSIMAAGLPDGNYHLGVNDVVVVDGDAKLASNGTRAGSTLTQDVALKNMRRWLPYSLEEILPTLSENPAKEMGLWDRKGSLETGKNADVVLLDDNDNVIHVFARGKQVK
ncbi:MAG: N-acetylglucosamine-6-phosphate deacetylase [Clostridiales bacterium]|nr:N-acetylglucosamine-6-phosphate deacetylase [Clostridiales bacterium]